MFTAYRLPWWRGETLGAWAGWLAAAERSAEGEAKHRAAREVYDALGAHARWQGALPASNVYRLRQPS